MADVNQRYIVQFKVITQAERELLNLTNALANPIKNIGPLYVHFFNNLSGGFKQIHADILLLGGAFSGVFQLMSGAFNTLVSAMRPVISYLKDAVKEGRAFTDSMVLVTAATGGSIALFEKMALSVAAMGMGAKDAADGMDTLVRAGLGTKEVVGSFMQVVKFSKAIGVSIDKTATLLVGAMRAFRGEGLSAGQVLDQFAYAILKTRFNFETFSTAFAFGGAAAAGFGQKMQETIAVMIKFYDMGIRASTVGTLMRELFTRLTKPTREAQLALLQYGLTVKDVDPATHSLVDILKTLSIVSKDGAVATTLFGRRTAGIIAKLLSDVGKYKGLFENLTTDMAKYTDLLTKLMISRLKTLSGQVDVFSAHWSSLQVQIYKGFEPTAARFMEDVNDNLASFRDLLAETRITGDQFIKFMLGQIKMLAIGFVELLFPVGKLVSAFNYLSEVPRGLSMLPALLASIFVEAGRVVTIFGTILEQLSKPFVKIAAIVERVIGLNFVRYIESLGFSMRETGESVSFLASSFVKLWAKAEAGLSFIDKMKLGIDLIKPGTVENKITTIVQAFFKGMNNLESKTAKSLKAMEDNFKKMFEELPDDAAEAFEVMDTTGHGAFVKLRLDAAKELKAMNDVLASGGGIGPMMDKMIETAEKYGPKIANTLRDYASELVASTGTVDAKQVAQAFYTQLRMQWEKELADKGFFFGITPEQANKAIMHYNLLSRQMVDSMVATIAKNPMSFVEALVKGTDLTAEQRAVVDAKAKAFSEELTRKLNENTKATALKMPVKFSTTGMAESIREFTIGMAGFKGSWNAIEDAISGTRTALDQLDPELAKMVETNLRGLQQGLGGSTVSLKGLAAEMEKASKAFVTADEKIRELDPAFATKFYQEIARGFKSMDPTMIEQNAKLVIDIAGRIKDLTSQTKTFGIEYQQAFIENLKKAAATMSLPAFQQYLMNLQLAQSGTEELRQSLLKYDEVLITTFALENNIHEANKEAMIDAILKNKELVTELQKRHDSYVKMSQKAVELETELINIDRNYKNALVQTSAEGRAIWASFATGVGTLMDAMSQRAVDSTVKIGEAIKGMLRQIAAELVKQTLVKSLFTGIFGGIFGLHGDKMKGLTKAIFGGQHGTTLAGVHGPGGTDTVPIMATPKEILLDKNASDAFREMIATGGSLGGRSLALSVSIQAMDGASVKRVFQKDLVPMINSQLRGNVGISSDIVFRSQSNLRKRPR